MLQIGSIKLELPVIQAALSGYSDWPMRATARWLGAPYTIAEVMVDSFVTTLKDRKRTKHFLMVEDADHPVAAQLMGADPADFPEAARRMYAAGFDVIDINFGCPVKKVLGRCRGGFHLGQPEVALEIVRRVRDALPETIPVTLKMRRGVDDSNRSQDQFYEILEGAFAGGVAAVTIHGRTVMQRYLGPSNWAFLKEVKQAYQDRTILGSGDLFSATDCVRMLQETGVDGVSAARGAIGNPWIFAQARALLSGHPLPDAPSVFEQREVLKQHFSFAQSAYGPKRVARQMRKFGMRYAEWHPRHAEVKAAFIACSDVESWNQVLSRWYSLDHPGTYPETPSDSAPSA